MEAGARFVQGDATAYEGQVGPVLAIGVIVFTFACVYAAGCTRNRPDPEAEG